eukprot:SAG31_NODE_883_length_11260_cov_38.912284_3_plen_129_part_00
MLTTEGLLSKLSLAERRITELRAREAANARAAAAEIELLELCECETKIRDATSANDNDAFRTAIGSLLAAVVDEGKGKKPTVRLESQPARDFAAQLLADNHRHCATVDNAAAHTIVEALVDLTDCWTS